MRSNHVLVALTMLLACPSLMYAGSVSGKVTYTGTPAKRRAIDMSSEPACVQQHATAVASETVVTGANNGLANVVIYISAGAADEGQVPPQAVTFEQKGCQYIPHVVAL